ncbi:MAG: (d)CMP kinase [Oscillospiraceae bacterium]|jgi:cytidylate kinase
MTRHYAIAIDGPSGAGKSTIAKLLAEALGFLYVDTGAIYRTVGVAVKRSGADSKDRAAVAKLLPELHITMRYDDSGLQRMFLNGDDVTDAIREPDISLYASAVSAQPDVRAFLLEMQRSLARENSVVMDGRDIGTVVLPQADVKIFLTASPEERAQRRYAELLQRGVETSYDEVLRDLKRRDENDSTRALAPLVPADDAIEVDTTGNSLEESFQLLKKIIEGRLYSK